MTRFMEMDYYMSEAKKGNAEIAYKVAKFFEADNDSIAACNYYRIAANNGSILAMRTLGILGLSGQLLCENATKANMQYCHDNCHEAITWLFRAAAKNDAESKYLIAKCIQHGIGMKQDLEKAHQLLPSISQRLNPNSIYLLVILVQMILDHYENTDSNQIRELTKEEFLALAS